MKTYRVLHEEEPGYGWGFTSPDVPDMIGGDDTYDESRRMAEEAVRFTLERDDVVVEHFVPEATRTVSAA
jgi:predicted RNase H-like HicB family nuclease